MDSPHPVSSSPGPSRLPRLPVLLLVALPLASACFTYTEVGLERVAPGDPVRIRMFEQAADRLPAQLERRTQVEGTVVEFDDARLSLLPELGSPASDPVALAVSDIETVLRRELNQTLTWVAAGVGAALGIGLLLAIEGEPASTTGGPITEFMWGWSLSFGR